MDIDDSGRPCQANVVLTTIEPSTRPAFFSGNGTGNEVLNMLNLFFPIYSLFLFLLFFSIYLSLSFSLHILHMEIRGYRLTRANNIGVVRIYVGKLNRRNPRRIVTTKYRA